MTLRRGDRIVPAGRPDQVCDFQGDLYLNAGAARIPTAHETVLGYAKSLGVPIEVMVNANRASKWDFGGRTYSNRQMQNDLRGRFTELLAKAVDRGALDQEIPAGEKTMLRQFLSFYAISMAAALQAERALRLC